MACIFKSHGCVAGATKSSDNVVNSPRQDELHHGVVTAVWQRIKDKNAQPLKRSGFSPKSPYEIGRVVLKTDSGQAVFSVKKVDQGDEKYQMNAIPGNN